jgi:choline kinase
VYGTFENGRIEEYFESNPLTPASMRDQVMSEYIAIRMAELHSVDITSVEQEGWDVGVRQNIRSWITPAKRVLTLVDQETRDFFDIKKFVHTWEAYWNWIRRWESEYGESTHVFAHNDAQYGNLLQLANPLSSRPSHHQVGALALFSLLVDKLIKPFL